MAEALATLITLVAHAVLFTREFNENSDSPMDPFGAFDPEAHDEAFLAKTGSFCFYWDDNRLVERNLYEIREILLPAWLSLDEWLDNTISWKYVWEAGVDPQWPEAWQRGLSGMSTTEKSAAARLLTTHAHNRFRSAFRKNLAAHLVEWLESKPEDRRYDSPFSRKQWGCLVTRDDTLTGESIYRNRGGCTGAPQPTT